MADPRVPKFRVRAALVSPASLFLIGGVVYYFSLDKRSDDELNSNIGREFPNVVRDRQEVDDRMREFFRRVNNNDPKEEERMRELLNKGKGSHYNAKRRHATTKEVEEFGFVPNTGVGGSGSGARGPTAAAPTTIAPLTDDTGKRPPGWGAKTLSPPNEAEEGGEKRRRWWRFW